MTGGHYDQDWNGYPGNKFSRATPRGAAPGTPLRPRGRFRPRGRRHRPGRHPRPDGVGAYPHRRARKEPAGVKARRTRPSRRPPRLAPGEGGDVRKGRGATRCDRATPKLVRVRCRGRGR